MKPTVRRASSALLAACALTAALAGASCDQDRPPDMPAFDPNAWQRHLLLSEGPLQVFVEERDRPTLTETVIDYRVLVTHDRGVTLRRVHAGFAQQQNYRDGLQVWHRDDGALTLRTPHTSCVEVAPYRFDCHATARAP